MEDLTSSFHVLSWQAVPLKEWMTLEGVTLGDLQMCEVSPSLL